MNILKHTLLTLLIPITAFLAHKAIIYFRPSLETLILIKTTLTMILFVVVFPLILNKKRKNQNKRRIKNHMSDAMTEIDRGTYFKDRSKLKPKTKNNNKSNKKEKPKYDKKRIN